MTDSGHARDAVAALVAKIDEGAMATRFVVLIEVIDAAGTRATWALTDDDATATDVLGLIDYARAREYGKIAREEAE